VPVVLAFLALTTLVTPVAGQDTPAVFTVGDTPYRITGDLGGFSLTIGQVPVEPRLDIVTLHLTHPTPKTPPPVSLEWSIPSLDVQGHWSTRSYFGKSLNADWYPSRVTSMLTRDAPVIELFGRDDGNRLTFAVSEGLHTVRLSSGIREEDGTIHNTIGFFSEKHRALTDYRVDIRIDRRAVPYWSWRSMKIWGRSASPPSIPGATRFTRTSSTSTGGSTPSLSLRLD
jgi:alpha-galactosidase